MINEEQKASYILTADIGGSHITTAVCLNTRQILPETWHRRECNSGSPAEKIFDSWCGCLNDSLNSFRNEIDGVGLAMPGPFDYVNGVSYIRGLNKYESLYELDIRQEISFRINVEPHKLLFRNDAEATVAGEIVAGTGAEFSRVLGVTLGTGFGSAFCNEQIIRDVNLGSEAFKYSIADDYLSTRWFRKRYFELTGNSIPGVKELALLAENESFALKTFHEFADNFSEFLSPYLKYYNPQVVVLCGNISKASKFFLARIREALSMPVILAELGENAALLGAASLFLYNDIGRSLEK